MRQIPLTNGRGFALVDDADFDRVTAFGRWRLTEIHTPNTIHRYAITSSGKRPNRTTVSMHTFLMDTPRGMQVDHEDSNGLNNQRSNLRVCSHAQNQHNQRKTRGSSKYKGVCFASGKRKWMAAIKVDSKRRALGYFDNEEDAARAYDTEALKAHGVFARINFPVTA